MIARWLWHSAADWPCNQSPLAGNIHQFKCMQHTNLNINAIEELADNFFHTRGALPPPDFGPLLGLQFGKSILHRRVNYVAFALSIKSVHGVQLAKDKRNRDQTSIVHSQRPQILHRSPGRSSPSRYWWYNGKTIQEIQNSKGKECIVGCVPPLVLRFRLSVFVSLFWQFVCLFLALMVWDAKLWTFYFPFLFIRSGWRTQCVDAAVDWHVICFFHFNHCLEAGFEWFCGFWCCFQVSIVLPKNWNNVEILGGRSLCLLIAMDLK